MIPRRILRLCVAAATALALTAHAEDGIRLFTGPAGGTQHRLAGELAAHLAPLVGSPIETVAAGGPTDILQHCRDSADRMSLALLPADLAQSLLFTAERNAGVASWLAPLRVVAPLHGEELHFIVRADSGLRTLEGLRDARINVGPLAGGTALSVVTLYRLLFGVAPAPDKLGRLGHEQALAKMLTERSIDVVAVLGDQPVPLLAAMKPEARRFIRLLRFDPDHAASAAVLGVYDAASLRSATYPNLLEEDQPTLAVRLYLAAHGARTGEDDARLVRLADAYCQELPQLKAEGHSRWRELPPGLPRLAPGWHYAGSGTPELARCMGLTEPVPDTCLPQEQALGLCAVKAAPGPAATGDGAPR